MRRWLVAGFAVLVVGGAVLLGAYWWASTRPDCGGADASDSTAGPAVTDPSAAAEYWTPERMASARPVEMPAGGSSSC